MNIDVNTNLYCLIGNPVSKSLSPFIHNTSFEMNQSDSVYLAFKVDDLDRAIEGIKALDIKGFNVTMPYKEKIIKYMDDIDEVAKNIGAINTVINNKGKLKGFNTDGLGFLKALDERNITLSNKKVLVLGSGGASRGVSMTLASKNISKLSICNRTRSKGEKLVSDIGNCYKDINVEFIEKDNIKDEYDMVVNTTSIGMYPNEKEIPIDPSIFNSDTIIYDIIYKPRPTEFLKMAKDQGKTIIDGSDMVIYQALISENIWLDKEINVFLVKNEIKKRIV